MSASPGNGEPLAEGTLISHLLELRDRVLHAVIAVAVCFVPLAFFQNELFTLIAQPLIHKLPEGTSLIATSVVSPFMAPLKLTIIVALFIAMMFQFLASTTPVGVKMMTDISNYLDFVLLLFFAFGVAFEMPVAVVLLVATGLVKVEALTRNRGYVILGIFIIAAFLTPPDAVSQSFMAVPMYLLYELGIVFARFAQRRRAVEPAGSA